MDLEEQYEYLIRAGILVKPDPDKVSVYDYARFRDFENAIHSLSRRSEVLDDVLSRITSIRSDLEDLEDDLIARQ